MAWSVRELGIAHLGKHPLKSSEREALAVEFVPQWSALNSEDSPNPDLLAPDPRRCRSKPVPRFSRAPPALSSRSSSCSSQNPARGGTPSGTMGPALDDSYGPIGGSGRTARRCRKHWRCNTSSSYDIQARPFERQPSGSPPCASWLPRPQTVHSQGEARPGHCGALLGRGLRRSEVVTF